MQRTVGPGEAAARTRVVRWAAWVPGGGRGEPGAEPPEGRAAGAARMRLARAARWPRSDYGEAARRPGRRERAARSPGPGRRAKGARPEAGLDRESDPELGAHGPGRGRKAAAAVVAAGAERSERLGRPRSAGRVPPAPWQELEAAAARRAATTSSGASRR